MASTPVTLVDRFRATADASPNALAVVDSTHQANYREIFALAGKVSRHLLESGLKKGDRVSLLVANSVEYVGIFYGIWAAGGVTVALNTQAKARDIINWVSHSGTKWLFVDQRNKELGAIAAGLGPDIELIGVGEGMPAKPPASMVSWQAVIERNPSDPAISLTSSDLASIIYTSGTTGHPKGVTLSHGNLSANVASILAYLGLSKNDSILNVLPFYYSYGNSVLHTHLAVGGSLILENSLAYPHRVVEKIATQGVSGFSGVPSTFALLLGRVNLLDYDLSKLRYITQAGGAMAPVLIDRLLTALPHIDLFVMYGQTEATARLTYLPPDKLKEKRGSIGIAIPDTVIQVRNKQGRIAKPQETGEICAAGKNIMQGYWRDSEKTAQVLRDGRLYTGDLAHTDSDGYLYIDGRSSDMIKSGANRISPKEIEEVIQELDGILEVAVVGCPDEMLGEIIKAYVVPKKQNALDKREIQHHCKNNLAIYKIPRSIEFIDELPKTASGKVKKYLLQDKGS
ncbi:MAG: acyl--CoA ligase [Candidatus Thiodiazotropha sp. (ex Dulcina madagascariensis)]|nr:acyl--CoA ligase [Candidatus Thiodiazotropha sp. (ex Dulcina madagascariensis)]